MEKNIKRLEAENTKLKNDQFEQPETEEIGLLLFKGTK